jgi:hypothetical protein
MNQGVRTTLTALARESVIQSHEATQNLAISS